MAFNYYLYIFTSFNCNLFAVCDFILENAEPQKQATSFFSVWVQL